MSKNQSGELVKKQESFTDQIKIGENTVNIPCILDFNVTKITGVVNFKILTKHLSTDPKQRELFLLAAQKVIAKAYDGFLNEVLFYEKAKSGAGPNQGDLFKKEHGGEDEGALVNVGDDDYEDEED